ncbi:MAG: sugar phosphate isomerase/epimerase family protein [Nocardioidaceae bacterium]
MCFGNDGKAALASSLQRRGIDRRTFLRTVAGGALAAGVLTPAGAAVAAPAPRGVVPRGAISIQMFTLRSLAESNLEPVLAGLQEDGYGRVELAGYYGRTAAQMQSVLSSFGISGSSSHDGIGNLDAKIDNALTLGQRFIVVPFLASNAKADWQRWASEMNTEAAAARAAGLRYGYHNHAHEFTTDLGGGETPWDVLMAELDPDLVHLEVDLYWAVTGGQDPVELIDSVPLQVLQYHVKDRRADGFFADPGTGTIDFARIFKAHAVREYIVENDQPADPMVTAQVGYDYLRTLRF